MKVWFGCTTANWLQYRKQYFEIRNYLKELGCIVLFDWLEDADVRIKNKDKKRNIDKIYQNITQAIRDSDAVVIERTVPGFSSSHQINYSLFQRKPTLVMLQPRKDRRFANSYLEALKSPSLVIKEYNSENYKDILKQFIGHSKIEQGAKRYNVVLDKKHKYYLDWASIEKKKSRSLILRDLVEKAIQSDADYSKYIKDNF
ncbi:MAG TPA: hypothetical protein ENI23_03945 [bacterium]|nr:hypothetical protein [bacterium]